MFRRPGAPSKARAVKRNRSGSNAIGWGDALQDRTQSDQWPDRPPNSRRSIAIGLDHRFGKGARRFLRQIVPDAALDEAVRVAAGEFFRVGGRFGMRRAVGVALESDGRHSDRRRAREPLLEIVIFG